MGVGEMGQIIGETGVGEMGVGKMGVIQSDCSSDLDLHCLPIHVPVCPTT